MPSVQSISARTYWSSIHFHPYTFLYGRIWIEVQFISAHTLFCTGGYELKINMYGRIWIELQSKSACPFCTGHNGLLKTLHFPINLPVRPVQIHIHTYFCTGGNELNEQYVWADMDWTSIQIRPSILYGWIWIEEEIKFSSFYLFKVSKSIQRFRSYSQQQILLSIGKNTSIGVAEIFTSN